jgi:c-di-GMP-binding flagellar brake protein YcgR
MIKKLMKKSGLKAHIKRKFARGHHNEKLCATILINYKPGDKVFKYGDCFSTRTYDLSTGGFCISHPDRLLPDKYIMLNSKNNLKKVECINCAMVGIVSADFSNKAIIAKVIWASENRCGLKIVDVADGDKKKLERLAKVSPVVTQTADKK